MNVLNPYLEHYGLASLEKQNKLQMLISDPTHELDLEVGVLRFNDLELPMQIIGTESENTLNWLWAWSDEQAEIPTGLMQSAIQLRTWGAGQDLPEFMHPSVDLNKADGHALSLIASAICKASCYYRDSYDGGSVYVLLFDKLIDQQPSFDRAHLVRQLTELVSRYDLNHRTLLLSYFKTKGWEVAETATHLSCELESGERLIAEFNEAGRLSVLNGQQVDL